MDEMEHQRYVKQWYSLRVIVTVSSGTGNGDGRIRDGAPSHRLISTVIFIVFTTNFQFNLLNNVR
jgi:hypothetical protein